jgi:hypothetical protein
VSQTVLLDRFAHDEVGEFCVRGVVVVGVHAIHCLTHYFQSLHLVVVEHNLIGRGHRRVSSGTGMSAEVQ